MNRMLSGLKGPDPPPQPCSAAALPTVLSARQIPPREKREGGGGAGREGYPARCPHRHAAAGKGGGTARLCYPSDLLTHKSWFLGAWEAPSTRVGTSWWGQAAPQPPRESTGTALVREHLWFLVPWREATRGLAGTVTRSHAHSTVLSPAPGWQTRQGLCSITLGTWCCTHYWEEQPGSSPELAQLEVPPCVTHPVPFPCQPGCNYLPKRDT